jgi:hypothetical protein
MSVATGRIANRSMGSVAVSLVVLAAAVCSLASPEPAHLDLSVDFHPSRASTEWMGLHAAVGWFALLLNRMGSAGGEADGEEHQRDREHGSEHEYRPEQCMPRRVQHCTRDQRPRGTADVLSDRLLRAALTAPPKRLPTAFRKRGDGRRAEVGVDED